MTRAASEAARKFWPAWPTYVGLVLRKIASFPPGPAPPLPKPSVPSMADTADLAIDSRAGGMAIATLARPPALGPTARFLARAALGSWEYGCEPL